MEVYFTIAQSNGFAVAQYTIKLRTFILLLILNGIIDAALGGLLVHWLS